MKIYTGRGDEGMTDLRDMSRVSKTSPRIEAYGTVDELNSLVGRARPTGHDDVDEKLAAVQNHLHVVQADFSNPNTGDEDTPQVESHHVGTLEEWMDACDDELDPLESFILPGGGDAGARLHHARSVCRRAERRARTPQGATRPRSVASPGSRACRGLSELLNPYLNATPRPSTRKQPPPNRWRYQ